MVDEMDVIVDKVLMKLKRNGLTYSSKKSAFKKTEELLYKYKLFKTAIDLNQNTQKAKEVVELIDNALLVIEDDEYYELIPLIFFEHKTREYCADYYRVEPITITRNKNKLINKLKHILFPDDAIEELYK